MDVLELSDIFPVIGDDDLSDLNIEQPWLAEMFETIDEKIYRDDLLTDIMSKNMTKNEPSEADVFEFANDMIVGDEVEVNNDSPPCLGEPAVVLLKSEICMGQEHFSQNHSSDSSSDNFRMSSDIGSACSTPSNMSDSYNGSSVYNLSPCKKLKHSPTITVPICESPKKNSECLSSPLQNSDVNQGYQHRVHYVIQKGQTLILQSDKISSLSQNTNLQTRFKPGLTNIPFQPRIVDKNGYSIISQPMLKQDAADFNRIKGLNVQQHRRAQVYPPTPPGSQTSSDTDTGDSPTRSIESRQYHNTASSGQNITNGSINSGRIPIFTRVGSNSSLRIPTSIYTSRYTSNSPTTSAFNQKQEENCGIVGGYGVDSGDFKEITSFGNSSGSGGSYSDTYSSSSYRQQPLFQNTQMAQSGLLLLNEEEKRTLIAEGYTVPTRLPLSKQEERNLKKIRRKIKNKISAQESRRKKKEYVETLEKRVEVYSQENSDLKRRLDGLEGTNRSLLSQLRHLQQLVNKSVNGSNTSSSNPSSTSLKRSSATLSSEGYNNGGCGSGGRATSTCLMVFLLCFAALFAGQPTGHPSGSSINFHSPSPRHIVGDLSTFDSLHQIGYTWSGKNTVKSSTPFPDGDYARGPIHGSPNQSALRDHQEQVNHNARPTPNANQSDRCYRNQKTLSEEFIGKNSELPTLPRPVMKSRLLGSSKEFEECEPVTWWEYFFGYPRNIRENVPNFTETTDEDYLAAKMMLQLETHSNYQYQSLQPPIIVSNQSALTSTSYSPLEETVTPPIRMSMTLLTESASYGLVQSA